MKRIHIIFLFFFFSCPLWGQETPVPVTTSSEQVRIEGQLYYIHLTLKKQTLYSIARHYGVSIDEIKSHNPELTGTLKEGDRLKIPVKDKQEISKKPPVSTDSSTYKIVPASSGTPVTMPVSSNRTPSQSSGTPVTTPDLPNRTPPQSSDTPVTTPDSSAYGTLPASSDTTATMPDSSNSSICTYFNEYYPPCRTQQYNPHATTYQAALLLPFDNFPETDFTLVDTLKEFSEERYRTSDNYLEFYAGLLLAAEDMKQLGLSLQLSIYDTKDIDLILSQNYLQNTDLIIGPIYANLLQKVSPYARQYRINLVSPLDPKSEYLLSDNPTLFQVPPPLCSQQEVLLKSVSRKTDRVILIYENPGEEELVNSYKALLKAKTDSLVLFCYRIEKGLAMRNELIALLRPNMENRIVVASNNEALVSDLISNLSYIQSSLHCPITLYGQARWRNFENVDLSFFHHMNLHLAIPFFVDYQREAVRHFVSRYRLQFGKEPSQYAFQGFDVGKYFMMALHNYGRDFASCITLMNPGLLQGNYIFRRNSPTSGYINTGSSLVRYMPNYTITGD